MIFFPKTHPAPTSLSIEKAKGIDGNYRQEDVIRQLALDFKNKCYICEYKHPPSINIEHYKSHRKNLDLKFDWNNIYFACAHCNNLKLHVYDNILDCTIRENHVDKVIYYKMDPFPYKEVEIRALKDELNTNKTAELLNYVYNGKTSLKTIEAENIQKELLNELLDFQSKILAYCKLEINDTEDEERKRNLKYEIKDHLNNSSAFTAFKRWIIRDTKDNSPLKRDFINYCD